MNFLQRSVESNHGTASANVRRSVNACINMSNGQEMIALNSGMNVLELHNEINEICTRRYNHCMILGHGSTIKNQYIIIPKGINVVFYVEKGEALEGNRHNKVFRNISNEEKYRYLDTHGKKHFINEDMVIPNGSITLLNFHQYNPIEKFFGNIVNHTLINKINYSGIITQKNIVRFYNLDNSKYPDGVSEVGILPISSLSGNENDFIKIFDFGENIYGFTESDNKSSNSITIINTMNSWLENEIPEYTTLLQMILERIGLTLDDLPEKIPLNAYENMLKMALIYHNTNIISFDELKTNMYHINLGKILNKIKLYNSSQPENKKINLCHNLICRSWNNSTNNNLLSISLNEIIQKPHNKYTNRNIIKLTRHESFSSIYREIFRNITEKCKDNIEQLNSILPLNMNRNNCLILKRNIKKKYNKIMGESYATNGFLNNSELNFIINLSLGNIENLKSIKYYA